MPDTTLFRTFYDGYSHDAYKYLGAHYDKKNKTVTFRVYAPNAQRVYLTGDFNDWENIEMQRFDAHGTYEYISKEAKLDSLYKFRFITQEGQLIEKADPYAFKMELRPGFAGVVTDLDEFKFTDAKWMKQRTKNFDNKVNIYEMHFGSWRRKEDSSWYTYKELTPLIIEHVKKHRFTHIELMPIMEHPLDASWGYQVSGFFSTTSRYGSPQELMYFINECHNNDIGVILDFVPAHFVADSYSLSKFDGTNIYEYGSEDVEKTEWGSYNFDYSGNETSSFVLSSLAFWLERFHFDGIRMDAIRNLIFWQGVEERGVNDINIEFLKKCNSILNQQYPEVMLIAEDSSSYPNCTLDVKHDGLGFDYKWDMGWMHDTLRYFKLHPKERIYHPSYISFSMYYYYNEKYLLPLSHDEVVHGKQTIIDKIWGNYEQKFAQLRLLYLYMYTHPGKKLNFMGNETAHFREWHEYEELDWVLMLYPEHAIFLDYFSGLMRFYSDHPSLYEKDYDPYGFQWTDPDDFQRGIFGFYRITDDEKLLILFNFSEEDVSYDLQLFDNLKLECIFSTEKFPNERDDIIIKQRYEQNEPDNEIKKVGNINPKLQYHVTDHHVPLGAFCGYIYKCTQLQEEDYI